MEDNQHSYGYGKRPLWQWILLYILIGGVLYALAYYFFFAGKGGYSAPSGIAYGTPSQQMPVMPGQSPTQPTQAVSPQTPSQSVTSPAKQASPTPAHVSATITNFAFNPATITIKKGDTVTWTNSDSAPHTVTGDAGAFSSQTLSQGTSFSHTFNTTGTFSYHCSIHPSMHGTVVVTQ